MNTINKNLKRKKSCRFTIAEEEQIISLYQEGKSMRYLGEQYQCSPTTIKNILAAYDAPSRNLSEARRNFLNYTLNEEIFETVDTADKAYWLGVMYTDGYISKASKYTNSVGLAIASKDIEWLGKFKEFLGYSGEIHEYVQNSGYAPGSPYVRLIVGSNKLVSDLEELGVVEHKTKKISSLPPIDVKYLDDFIRGVIDGDGSLRKTYPDLRICGNKDFLLEIAKYFQLPYKIYPDKNIYDLVFSRQASIYLEKRLYSNAHYYLDRKHNIAQRSFNSPLTLEDVKENSEYQGKPLEP